MKLYIFVHSILWLLGLFWVAFLWKFEEEILEDCESFNEALLKIGIPTMLFIILTMFQILFTVDLIKGKF